MLPPEDIFANHNFVSQWLTHPIKRRLAKAYLNYLRRHGEVEVIGITGSVGKTTTTAILASILKRVGKTVCSAEGVDPVYNIPNTILKATPATKFLILEMSVEYIDEMDYYLWLAKPDMGIITNIAVTHTEYLKNKEGVAEEKGKIIKYLDKNATAILNMDDPVVQKLGNNTKAKIVYFGEKTDVSASNIKINNDMSTNFTLKINMNTKIVHMNALGKQFVNNALAAAAAADSLGVGIDDIIKGIELFERPRHRLTVIKSDTNGIIFDDTYNSNPRAASESLDTFTEIAGTRKKIAVIGDMLELGKFEEQAHRELGKKAGSVGLSYLIGVGSAARFIVEEASKRMGNKYCFLVSNFSEALQITKPLLGKDTALFVKGSRSIHLDKLVESLN
ncbi:MAG: UDP-N-acetylmuramoyl-tripeptide-D-alanyl-D-alanine ligase [Microgenomates group bacterium GW2011_GWC1_41_20]|uniref:UDP-N-acetylmuramoyl-tripeptide-D-alanyl-D-alanine ligase n=1 Tax=Candidatus Woesebacteria bacterium GW2011_GWE1_41_24 TaxID=1618597 RepID=A0A0G0Y724_9BACT|nr:MAG: UDP-N-acetylmuramoyl-tripeptide-D-alanyl-D-alanine ligase [Microgenomates group bacterium GW2011_GWC1_41_20]KKS05241.1 MAG: UDP-N-acetylmuramoyl-tripeptide-D-alanyl-D-alanine ligase [Candidatus Woesebacteria bacterium GW2011_GWE1_41_24]